MNIRFIHTADWQLGKAFGRFDPDVRAALTEARFDAIDALGRAAAEHGIGHILVAGDIFDTEGPDDRTIIQAVTRMTRFSCRWWLLPGNHDFSRNGGLWDRVRRHTTETVVVLSHPEPFQLEPGVWLLPAPLAHRLNLEDPTELFETMRTSQGDLRIGLAHGSIHNFSCRGEANNQIAPDRAKRSSLDYLALGDWHGALKINARTWYSGAPEPDRFQRDDPGQALRVKVEAGGEPIVEPFRTGRFRWLMRQWTANDMAALEAQWLDLLVAIDPANTFLQLTLRGIGSLGDRIGMLAFLENDVRHRLRQLDLSSDDLVASPSEADLASMSVEGILGEAADKLKAQIAAGGASVPTARRALERLFIEYGRQAQS